MNAQEQLSEKGPGKAPACIRITKAITAAGQYLVGVVTQGVPDSIPQYIDTSFIEKLPK
jgi:hypothetical protein